MSVVILGLMGDLVWSQTTASTQNAGPSVSFSDIRVTPNRTSLDLQILDFPGMIDQEMKGRGNLLRRCSKRLFWLGGTRVLESSNERELRLSARLRYQQWLCAIVKTRLFSKADNVQWRLFIPTPQDSIKDKVTLNLQVIKVGDHEDSIEKSLNLDRLHKIDLLIPEQCGKCTCSKVFEALQPIPDKVEFSQVDTKTGTVKLTLEFQVANERESVLECI